MTPTLFLGFLALMAALVVALSARYLKGPTAFAIGVGLFIWLIYVGLLGYLGVIGNATMRPPGIAFIFVPVVLFLVFFIVRVRSSAALAFAPAGPDGSKLTALQVK